MAGNIRSILLLTLGLIFIRQSLCLTKPTSVKLEDNGYTGVVFAIHYDEPECDKLIEELKEMITNASAHLYKATKHRAYFREVTILIPATWEDKEEYRSPRNATIDGADVIIASGNPRYSQGPNLTYTPYTKHYEGCGKRAVHIHFTSQFLLSDEVERHYGEKGRILVHEWGHYRWGLFDEYPDPDPRNMEQFYFSLYNELWEPTRCTRGIDGENVVFDTTTKQFRNCTGNPLDGYEDGCINLPSLAQPDSVTASLMSHYANIEEVVDFCDDENHNYEAPNKHNRLCDGRSAWNVMMDHEDFRDNNNPPREKDDVTPRIILARTKKMRYVLVLDTSGSMSNGNRIGKLSTASRNFILKIAREGSYIGIVDFDHIVTILSNLTIVDSEDTREELARRIPTTAYGGTCIGKGLQKAFEILSANGQSPAGGKVILITDGQDACSDNTTRAGMQLINAGVVIHAITIGQAADDELVDLAILSGGKLYHQGDEANSTGLQDAYIEVGGAGMEDRDRRIEIYRASSFFPPGESRDQLVFIDETVGNRTAFEFSYIQESASPAISVTVFSPDFATYDNRSANYSVNTEFKVVSINIEAAKAGPWKFAVRNMLTIPLLVFSNVYTHPSQHGVDPIIATSELSEVKTDLGKGEYLTVYAEVRQGFFPLIEAVVRATIISPTGSFHGINLRDGGADPDETEDDGIYSGDFTDYIGVGYYGISLIVSSNENTRVLDGGNTSLPYSCTLPSVDPVELLKGNIPTIGGVPILIPGMPLPELRGSPAPNFTRVVSGGSSQVTATPVNWTPGDDIFAPSRILDLSVTSTSYDNGTVTLEFTAPGDDLNNGNASYYVIRMSSSLVELQNNYDLTPPINETDIRYGDPSSPENAGVRERFVLSVDVPSGQHVVSYVFAMHAVDDVGNEGKMSNLVQATLRRFIPPPPPPPPTTEEVTTEAQKTTTPAPATSSASLRTEALSIDESPAPTSTSEGWIPMPAMTGFPAPATSSASLRTGAPSTDEGPTPTMEERSAKPAINGSRALAITLPAVVVFLTILAFVFLIASQRGKLKSNVMDQPDGFHDNTAFEGMGGVTQGQYRRNTYTDA